MCLHTRSGIALYQKVKYSLYLFFSFPKISEAATPICSFCTKVVPTWGCWVFYNHEHDHLGHLDCAAATEFTMESDSMDKLQNRLQTLAITNRPPSRASQPSEEIMHFTHRHSLKEYNSAKPLRCKLCNIKFLIGYICSGYNYFIDKICFSIPSVIQHISHPHHPLKLTWYSDFQNGNLKCPACQNYTEDSYERAYCCTECNFLIDRFCAGAPKILTLPDDNISYELFFSFPFNHEKADIKCDICSELVVIKDGMLL